MVCTFGCVRPYAQQPVGNSGRVSQMTADKPLSARLNAAFEGCYEASRASALSGVPKSTVYLWARNGLVSPSVSPTRVKLWSYADLMALRIVYWLRHPKSKSGGEVPASPMTRVRGALAGLDERGLGHLGRQQRRLKFAASCRCLRQDLAGCGRRPCLRGPSRSAGIA